MLKPIWENYNSFYFIGVGGVSMSGLAKFMLLQGKKVAGSDAACSEYTDELIKLGVKVEFGKAVSTPLISEYDAVVYTDAVSQENPQLIGAEMSGKKVFSRGQFLSEVSSAFKNVLAVAGCHGKTTTVSMLAHIFSAAGKKFAAHIGGKDSVFSNFFYSGNDYFITEACEYKKNFLLLKPDIAVVLSCGADHLECYGSVENLRNAYCDFASSAKKCIVLDGELQECSGSLTFGCGKNAYIRAENISSRCGKYSFSVYCKNELLGDINLRVYGRHNVLNALAAIGAAREAGISFSHIKAGLESFCGVERRFENIGKINGAQVIADYAHHPEELAAALRTAENLTKGRIFVVFQPHTYSRTKNLFNEFVRVLSPIENLLIYRTFAAREYFDDGGSALTLSQSIKNSRYGDCTGDIADFLKNITEEDMVLVLGAGDIYSIMKNLLKDISK